MTLLPGARVNQFPNGSPAALTVASDPLVVRPRTVRVCPAVTVTDTPRVVLVRVPAPGRTRVILLVGRSPATVNVAGIVGLTPAPYQHPSRFVTSRTSLPVSRPLTMPTSETRASPNADVDRSPPVRGK